jgi:hypothetical protein
MYNKINKTIKNRENNLPLPAEIEPRPSMTLSFSVPTELRYFRYPPESWNIIIFQDPQYVPLTRGLGKSRDTVYKS